MKSDLGDNSTLGWSAITNRKVLFPPAEGRAEIVDDAEALFKVGVSVWERYTGPYSEEMKSSIGIADSVS